MLGAYGDDECGFLAGALAYQLFFSLVPLLAVLIGVLGFVYGGERAANELGALLRQIYPSATDQETQIIRQLVDGRALSLGLGIVGTVLAALAIHASMDSALAAVLGREGRRSLLGSKLAALAFMLAMIGLALASFATSYLSQVAQGLLAWTGLGTPVRVAIEVLSPLVGLVVGFAFFYLIYRLVPRRRVEPGSAARAALVSAVLWEVAKLAFALLTRALGTFEVYGALAFAAGLLTWVYVTAAIVLIGAEVMKTERRA